MLSIRSKIMIIVLSFFVLVTVAFIIYSYNVTKNYNTLRFNEISETVKYEAETLAKLMNEMERNAIDLALTGKIYYHISQEYKLSSKYGEMVTIDNFSGFREAMGGGIWFEPFTIDSKKERYCFYAYYSEILKKVVHDSTYESEEYNYPNLMWYNAIKEGVQKDHKTVWTPPYYDETGSLALMTTVGAGIFDDNKKFIGISTVDWKMDNKIELLYTIKPTENSFVLFAIPELDQIIMNTHPHYRNRRGLTLSSLPWFSQLNIESADGLSYAKIRIAGKEYITFSKIFENNWLLSALIPMNEMYHEIEIQNKIYSYIIIFSLIIVLLTTSLLITKFINNPLKKLTQGVEELSVGNLDKQIDIQSKDELGTLASRFNKMIIDLKKLIDENIRERAINERITAELNVARQIQASMLPCTFPPFPDRTEFDLFATMISAKEVGGDFYDFFLVDEKTLAIVIADVSGKGIPAALFMIVAKTLINNNARSGKSPNEVFEVVNNLLCENNNASMFVTAFMGYLNLETLNFTFVNAGHNPPLICKAGGNFTILQSKKSLVLGGMEDMKYTQNEINLDTGDILYLYTDGVTEAENKEKRFYGGNRLMEVLNKYKSLTPRGLSEIIQKEIDIFVDSMEQTDDITMLVLKVK